MTETMTVAGDLLLELDRAVARHGARCADDPRFISDDTSADDELRGICAACPVLSQCAAYRLRARPEGGFWAGRRTRKYEPKENTMTTKRTTKPTAEKSAPEARDAATGNGRTAEKSAPEEGATSAGSANVANPVRFSADGYPLPQNMAEYFGMPAALAVFTETDWLPTCDVYGDRCTRRRAKWETWRQARELWVTERAEPRFDDDEHRRAAAEADRLYVLSTADSSHVHEYRPGGAR